MFADGLEALDLERPCCVESQYQCHFIGTIIVVRFCERERERERERKVFTTTIANEEQRE